MSQTGRSHFGADPSHAIRENSRRSGGRCRFVRCMPARRHLRQQLPRGDHVWNVKAFCYAIVDRGEQGQRLVAIAAAEEQASEADRSLELPKFRILLPGDVMCAAIESKKRIGASKPLIGSGSMLRHSNKSPMSRCVVSAMTIRPGCVSDCRRDARLGVSPTISPEP